VVPKAKAPAGCDRKGFLTKTSYEGAEMASPILPNEQPQEARPYPDFSNSLAYKLHELAFTAQATQALLREHEGSDSSETLVGVSYMLTKIQRECAAMCEVLDGTTRTYTLSESKEARNG
jgi:hypothetical protein